MFRIAASTAAIGLAASGLGLYGILGLMVAEEENRPTVWGWFAFQTCLRFVHKKNHRKVHNGTTAHTNTRTCLLRLKGALNGLQSYDNISQHYNKAVSEHVDYVPQEYTLRWGL